MDKRAFDAWTRRRFGAAAAGLTALVALGARNGEKCNKPGNNCKKQCCLKGPFTVTAAWTADTDHDTFLFVPAG